MGGAHPSTSSGAVVAINSASEAATAAALAQLSRLLSEVEMADACVPEDFPERPVSSGGTGAGIAAGEMRFKTTWRARGGCGVISRRDKRASRVIGFYPGAVV